MNSNSALHKTFKGLVIWVKNLLTEWKTERKNYRFKIWDKTTCQPKKTNLGRIIGVEWSEKKLFNLKKEKRKILLTETDSKYPWKGDQLGVMTW